jgi:uncharacterized membrane protein
MFPEMVLASIVDPGYKIALFLHILAVVLAFGPTFGYAFFSTVTRRYPGAAPAVLDGIQKCDRYLVVPGMVVLILAAFYLLADGDWESSQAYISVGFLAYAILLALQLAFFTPQVRRAREIAEGDLKSGDTLSDEYEEVTERIGKVGSLAGLIVVVTIFFMTYKPFL